MGPDDASQLIILFLLILLSAFFSSAETALTTANQIRLRGLAEDGNKKAKRLLKILEDSPKMLSAILIGNNIVNLTASSLLTALAIRLFGSYAAGIATAVLTVVILIFGEITPKTLATIHSDKIALTYCNVIYYLMKCLTPVIFIVNKLSLGVLFLLRVDPKNNSSAMTETELRTIVDVSHESGVLESEEREMINNVVDFGDSLAKDIMIPRIDMCCAEVSTTYSELLELFRQDMFSRLPVYEDDSDNVVGIINIKDLLFLEDKENFQVSKIMREPFFTYEYKKTSDLMLEMRKGSIPMAIVLDEYGATAGLITLEDLIEEIVGEIRDEYDSDEINLIQQLGDFEYSVAGSTKLDDLNDYLESHMDPEVFRTINGIPLNSEEYDSIGGIIIELLDHLPVAGEEAVTEEGIHLKVEQMDKNRIGRIRLTLPEPPIEEEPED